MKTSFFFICIAIVLRICPESHAAPLYMTGRNDELSVFPHSLCNSDFICTGTPVSTNGGHSAEFAVDEILWGTAPSTNVTIRYFVEPEERYKFQLGERYLVCAFTNDWWDGDIECSDYAANALSRCVTETNRPPNNAVFDEHVVLDSRRCAIPFRYINYCGTNYWDDVRVFVTNIIDIAKHDGDDERVLNAVNSILNNPQKRKKFPILGRQMELYKMFFHGSGM